MAMSGDTPGETGAGELPVAPVSAVVPSAEAAIAPATAPLNASPMPAAASTPAPAPVNVNVSQNVVVMQRPSGPGFLVRAVWFIFIGWWLSALSIGVAYFLCLIIIGLPLGFMIFNRLPAILTLRPRSENQLIEVRDGITYISGGTVRQYPMWARAIWFVLIGWWLGAIYLGLAWFLCVILITLPIGLVMFNRVGMVMTLLRY